MSFDFATKYAERVANASYDRVDREFIEAGSHVLKITATECITSQNTGNEMIILEGELIATDTMRVGEMVKHIWQLSGCEQWKTQRNLSQIKSLVLATLPADVQDIDADVVSRAIDNAEGASIVCGASIRVEVKKKQSKNGRDYLSYSFLRAHVIEAPSMPANAEEWAEGQSAWNNATQG